ncbi:hypothetical protein ODJ79_43955 [Actinoplanes sp. KI2]|uniref:hypothetical protein n=1 Tax=Actinoplanes sp. KI2 TaxID=2983315 RepID=UPI0021D590AE|nr:hypothetical protein [Actinoplanes sp. KI2]MCU7730714.1 hypothetical protein [Actinoplanes sp. KI2]
MKRQANAAPERALRCLGCPSTDALIRVEALTRQQRTVAEVRGRAPGPFGYPVPVRARIVHHTALAAALAPPRRPRSATAPAIVLGVAGPAAALNLAVAVQSGGAQGIAGVIIMGLLAAGSGWLLRARRAAAARTGPQVRTARWLWRHCWYCRRCGAVSLLAPALRAALPAPNLAATLLTLAPGGHGPQP